MILESAEIEKDYWEEYFKDIDAESITNTYLRREVDKLKVLGDAALDTEDLETVRLHYYLYEVLLGYFLPKVSLQLSSVFPLFLTCSSLRFLIPFLKKPRERIVFPFCFSDRTLTVRENQTMSTLFSPQNLFFPSPNHKYFLCIGFFTKKKKKKARKRNSLPTHGHMVAQRL